MTRESCTSDSCRYIATRLVRSHGGWQVRVAHDVDGAVVPLTGKYKCLNPACRLVRDSARSRAEKQEKEGGPKASDIVWTDATVLSLCKEGVAFNTMDARYQ